MLGHELRFNEFYTDHFPDSEKILFAPSEKENVTSSLCMSPAIQHPSNYFFQCKKKSPERSPKSRNQYED